MNKVIFSMTFTAKPAIIVSLTIIGFLLIVSGEELLAQQRGTISVDRAVALPLTTAEGNQVRVVVNYELEDESLLGQRVNAIMGIYDRNTGSLIKLSSFPNGFILNNTKGTTQLATTLTDNILQNVSAIVTLTNADKSEKYTNDVRADLDLRTILPTTLPPLIEDIPASQPGGSNTEEEGEDSPSGNEPGPEEE
ncbi:MAG: hypothetical protein ACRD8W_14005 [Nitrososphaeraceae archaeon]